MKDLPDKPKRRWLQFSLRTLLILVIVSAIPLCWVGWKREQARRQRVAIAWVEKMGGSVEFEDVQEKSSWQEWVDQLFAVPVRTVHLHFAKVSDLSALTELKNLEVLGLLSTEVSDEQVRLLRQALPNCKIHR